MYLPNSLEKEHNQDWPAAVADYFKDPSSWTFQYTFAVDLENRLGLESKSTTIPLSMMMMSPEIADSVIYNEGKYSRTLAYSVTKEKSQVASVNLYRGDRYTPLTYLISIDANKGSLLKYSSQVRQGESWLDKSSFTFIEKNSADEPVERLATAKDADTIADLMNNLFTDMKDHKDLYTVERN